MIIKFILFGLIGWIGEILFTGMGSIIAGSLRLNGHTYLWMFPIYGLAIFLEPIYKQIRSSPWFIRGIIWAGIIFLVEYFSGLALKLAIGVCPWDYSTFSRFTEDGFIRLDYFPVWFLTGLAYEKINYFLNHIQITYIAHGHQLHTPPTMLNILKDGTDFIEPVLARWLKNAKERVVESSKYIISKAFFSGSSSNSKFIK